MGDSRATLKHLVAKSIPEGVTRIVVGVSGGADSMALLRLLREEPGEVIAVHCNFQLRGDESERDEKFVRDVCASLEVPLTVLRFDTEKYAREHGVSIEMACRELRYAEFLRIAEESGAQRIAVAHHLDDNIETMLLNLFRGTGIRGLAGMQPDTGSIIRPLLDAPRELILRYLDDIKQPFVTDSSNLQSQYKRNFIRNELIPLLATRWPGIRKSLARTQSNLRSQYRVIEETLTDIDVNTDPESDHILLPYDTLASISDPQATILRLIAPCSGNGVQAAEIADAVRCRRYPRLWKLPEADAILDRDGLRILTADDPAPQSPPEFCEREIPLTAESFAEIRADRSNLTLYSPLPLAALRFRHPQNGDRVRPLGMKGSKLLSDILKDAKVPATRRKNLWLAIAPDGEILWVPGIIRSRSLLLSPDIHRVAFAISQR